MDSGKRTVEVARRLAQRAALQGYDVLFDHGQAGQDDPACLGQIASWFGDQYCAGARLALLDIAVVEGGSDRAVALIEVEESAAPPKVLLGDVLATLLGERITFQGQRDLQVGAWTTLIVLARSGRQPHPERLAMLQAQSSRLGQALNTPNASIGRVVVDRFGDDEALFSAVERCVEEAITGSA